MCPPSYRPRSIAETLLEVMQSPEFAVRMATNRATSDSPPKQQRDWFRFVTNKAQPETTEVHIYGDIGSTFFGEGVTAQDFVDQLDELKDAKSLDVRINSPGGSAWDGLTIANAIIRHPAHVTTHIDGLAASAASIVAVAGDRVVTSKYGQMMLHNAHAIVAGTSKDMREVAAQLDQLNGSMATYYADRAGGDPKDWSRAMSRETWYNSDEMLAAGLVTEIDTSAVREEVEKAAAHAMASTAERFRYDGRRHAPAPEIPPISNRTGRGRPMAEKSKIAESLGLNADATDDEIRAAFDKEIGASEPAPQPTEQDIERQAPAADEKPIVDAPAEPAKEVAAAAASAADGIVQLDQATYEALRRQAEQGAQAHATLVAQADARVVDAAIDDGKITPARRGHYLALMKADRDDTTDLLTKRLAPGAAVPLAEMGHAANTEQGVPVIDDPAFKAWEVL